MIAIVCTLLSLVSWSQSGVIIDREYEVKVPAIQQGEVRSALNQELIKAIANEFGTINPATEKLDEKLQALGQSSNRWITLSRPGEVKKSGEVFTQSIFVKIRLEELEKSLSRLGFTAASNSNQSFLRLLGRFPAGLQTEMKNSIRVAHRDIRGLVERRISKDEFLFEMAISGSLEAAGQKLNGLRVRNFVLKFKGVQDNELQMEVLK